MSPLHKNGTAWDGAAITDGVRLAAAVARKQRTYHELAGANPWRKLTVLAGEIGGRWNTTAVSVLRTLVRARIDRVHPVLKRAAAVGWHRRWWGLIGITLQDALAASLLEQVANTFAGNTDWMPCLAEVLENCEDEVEYSRVR